MDINNPGGSSLPHRACGSTASLEFGFPQIIGGLVTTFYVHLSSSNTYHRIKKENIFYYNGKQ